MKIDLDYMASFLKVFLDADTAYVNYNDMKNSGVNIFENDDMSEIFLFHIHLAIDNQLIGSAEGPVYNISDIGICQSLNGNYIISQFPIRLTQRGHDFAATLNNKEVLTRLKTELKDAPFKTIFDGGQQILQFILQKKLDSLLQ